VKPFYGEEAGAKLASLLREHILIAADIVKAAKAGDGDGVTKGQAAWRANAEDIADFFCRPAGRWHRETVPRAFQELVAQAASLAAPRISGGFFLPSGNEKRRHNAVTTPERNCFV